MTIRRLLIVCAMLIGLASPAFAVEFGCGVGTGACGAAPVEGSFLQNSQTTAATNTPVVVTLSAVTGVRHHVYQIEARCSAGTSNLTVTDGGTTIWSTAAAEVGAVNFVRQFPTALTGTTSSAVVVTLATCGVGNTGILIVQADRF